jgi:hypothetical protein
MAPPASLERVRLDEIPEDVRGRRVGVEVYDVAVERRL